MNRFFTSSRVVKSLRCYAALLFLLFAAQGMASADLPWLAVQGNQIKGPNGNRVILRGISLIDLGTQQNNYGGVTTLLDRITNKNDSAGSSPGWYPKVVRLPIMPPEYGGPWAWRPNEGDNFYNNLLRPIVNYCRQKDIYCIIDLHYIADINVNSTYVQQFWTYMAPRFANDSHVLFEVFNEPISSSGTDDQKWSNVKGYMQTWYNTIRNYAPRNLVLIGTPQYSQVLIPAVSNPVSGSNILYVVHTYPLHWGNGSGYNVDQITQSSSALPLFMTEWGFTQTSDTLLNGSISSYGQPLINLLDQKGISWTSWVASTDWGPPMFYSGWTLRVGQNEMGGFVKDSLYSRRNSDLPYNPGGQIIANGTYRMNCRNSGKALDAYGWGTADGTNVDQYAYGGGNNQRWRVTYLSNGEYSIINVNANKALDVSGGSVANGANVQLWTNYTASNQKWYITATSGGYYRVSPVHAPASALDVNGASTADGANVQIWAWGGGNNQQWSFSAP